MRIHLLAVGTRVPGWVREGFGQYAERLPRECELILREIPPARRTRSADIKRVLAEEERRLLGAVPAGACIVALDARGSLWTTEELSLQLKRWLQTGSDVSLLVGGPDGLSSQCLRHAQRRWSLSPLTFPHALVRVMIAEQLYRAWSIIQKHPYHRV